jgi:hypothetical protein
LVTAEDSLELAIGPIAGDDASRLANAACEIEPELRTSVTQLRGDGKRLLVSLERYGREGF